MSPVTTIVSNGMTFPVFYDALFKAYWTPRCAMLFDSIEELQTWCDELSGAVVIA